MPMKIQPHRMSRHWAIIGGVQYSAHPMGFDSPEAYEGFEKDFLAKHSTADSLVFKNGDSKVVWNPRFHLLCQRISFFDQGVQENLIFDGEAYICTNDGKTVQKIHAGGFVSHTLLAEAVPRPGIAPVSGAGAREATTGPPTGH
jgi:hypothetical protein